MAEETLIIEETPPPWGDMENYTPFSAVNCCDSHYNTIPLRTEVLSQYFENIY